MRKLIFTTLALHIFISTNLYAQKPESQIYTYPITVSDSEWNNFKTLQEKLDAIQIPTDLLGKMSTEDLLETVMNYPLLGDLMVYSDVQTGIDKVSTKFNGLEELLNRDDVGEIMKEYYLNLQGINSDEDIINLACLERMLSSSAVRNSIPISMVAENPIVFPKEELILDKYTIEEASELTGYTVEDLLEYKIQLDDYDLFESEIEKFIYYMDTYHSEDKTRSLILGKYKIRDISNLIGIESDALSDYEIQLKDFQLFESEIAKFIYLSQIYCIDNNEIYRTSIYDMSKDVGDFSNELKGNTWRTFFILYNDNLI